MIQAPQAPIRALMTIQTVAMPIPILILNLIQVQVQALVLILNLKNMKKPKRISIKIQQMVRLWA